jgi:hypothetical protein
MTDRIDPTPWPSPRGPWPEVTGPDRLHDHGYPWCANAAGHPDRNGGYPDADIHLPWHECRSIERHLDGGSDDLPGAELGLSLYLAAPFQFGAPRGSTPGQPRVVLEFWRADDDGRSRRITLARGEALCLARIRERLVDDLTFVRPGS